MPASPLNALVALSVMLASLSVQAEGFDASQNWRVLESSITPLPYDSLTCSAERSCFLTPAKEEQGYRVLRNQGATCTREERVLVGWRPGTDDPKLNAQFGKYNKSPVIVATASTVACPR